LKRKEFIMMSESLSKGFAEAVGTFALTFIGGAAIINGQSGLAGIAVAHGLTLAVMISCVGHISGGHLNPAVTAGFLVTGRMKPAEAAGYLCAQLIGASLAALMLLLLFPNAAQAHLGGQALAEGTGWGKGVIIEAVLTFLLVFTVFATAVDGRGAFKIIAGFGIGMVVAFDILAAGPITGASMNPARSFGPALIGNFWTGHSVYWIGPLIGGSAAALLYDGILMKKDAEGPCVNFHQTKGNDADCGRKPLK
jgi:MIP family channel proteins